jgi:hypothetical protein
MNILNKKGMSVVEYAVLFIIIIGAFLVMKNYIQRGMFGSWGQAGQTFAFGRQYDPQKTIECGFDEQSNLWYDQHCFNNSNCTVGNTSCEEGCSASSCSQINSAAY